MALYKFRIIIIIIIINFSSNMSAKEALEYYRLILNILCVT